MKRIRAPEDLDSLSSKSRRLQDEKPPGAVSDDLQSSKLPVHTLQGNPLSSGKEGEEDTLCARCASLDIKKLFAPWSKCPKGSPPRHLVDLGELGRAVELPSCSLCQLFNAVKLDLGGHTPREKTFALYSTRPPFPFTEKYSSVLTVLDSENGKLRGMSVLEKEAAYRGFIACVTPSEPTTEVIFSPPARRLETDSIDVGVLRGWLYLCRKTHESQCFSIPPEGKMPRGLKLIDCKQRRVVEVPPESQHQYAALSYVWGASFFGDDTGSSTASFPTRPPPDH